MAVTFAVVLTWVVEPIVIAAATRIGVIATAGGIAVAVVALIAGRGVVAALVTAA